MSDLAAPVIWEDAAMSDYPYRKMRYQPGPDLDARIAELTGKQRPYSRHLTAAWSILEAPNLFNADTWEFFLDKLPYWRDLLLLSGPEAACAICNAVLDALAPAHVPAKPSSPPPDPHLIHFFVEDRTLCGDPAPADYRFPVVTCPRCLASASIPRNS